MNKQIISWGMMLAAAFTLTNCTKEIDNPNQEPETSGIPFELVATSVDTKTDNTAGVVAWSADDAINIFHAEATTDAYINDGSFTIQEADLNDGRFTGNLKEGETLSAEKYDWYAFYPYTSQIETPANTSKGWTPVGSKHNVKQAQDGYDNMDHISGANYPLYGVAKNVASNDRPSITMNHAYSIAKIVVKNTTEQELTVETVSFTAPVNIVGTYYINFADESLTFTNSGDSYVSKTAELEVSNGTALQKDAEAAFYIAFVPFTAAANETLTLSVNGYSKEIKLTKDVAFAAGKIKTLNFAYDKVAQKSVTWDLSKNTPSEATENKIAWTSNFAEMYCNKSSASTNANNYYGGDANNRTSTRFYKGSILTIIPETGYKITSVVFTATSESYASALSGSTWVNASAELSSTTVTVTPTDGTQPMTATIGGTCGFTLVVVYYAENEGGETPEPEPKTLVSIAVENPQIEYTVGDEFVAPTVKATYDDASTATVTGATFAGNDLTSEGVKTVTVSYTEGDVNATTTYDITVSPVEILVEDGTYVIAVKEEGVYYAASIEANSARRAYVELSGYSSGDYVSHDSKIVWTIANSGAGIIVSSGEQYWGAVKNGVSLVETASVVSVAKSETEGAFYLSAECGSDGVRYLAKNGTYGFGFYAEAEDIYLIPAIFVELPTLETPDVAAVLNATGTGIDVSWTAVDNATSYVVSCTNQADQTVTSGTKCSIIDLAAGTYTISVTAKAENYNSATSKAVTVIVPAAEGEVSTYVFLASDLTAGTSYNNGKVNGDIAYKLGSSSKTGTLTFPSGYSEITFYAVGWSSGTNNLAVTNGKINDADSVTLKNDSIASGSLNNGFNLTGTFDDTYKYTIKVTDTSKSVVLSLKRGIVWGFEGVPAN